MKGRTAVTFVAGLRLLRWFSESLYLPSLPLLLTYFHTSRAVLQHSFLYFLSGMLLAQLFGSNVMLVIGKRRILILKMAIATAGALIILFSTTIFPFNLGRFVQGIGIGLAYAIGNVFLHEAFYHTEKTPTLLSYVGVVSAWFPTLVMFLGALIYNAFGWRANFILLIVLYVVTALLSALFLVKEPLHVKRFTWKELGSFRECLGNRIFRRYVLSYVLIQGSLAAYYLSSTFIYHLYYGFTPIQIALLALFPMFGHSLGNLSNVFLCKRFGRAHNMLVGLWICVFSTFFMTLGLYIWDLVWFLPVGLFAFSIGGSILGPQTSATVMALFAKRPISSMALMTALVTFAGIILGLISTWIHPSYPLGLALLLLGLSVVALVYFGKKN